MDQKIKVIDSMELCQQIINELPDERNSAYYALNMVLEMCNRLEQPLEDFMPGTSSGDTNPPHFEITIEADGVQDLRDQLDEIYEYTYSEEFEDCVASSLPFEYDSEEKIIHLTHRGDEE